MSETLNEVARQLQDCNKKVQLIYAFNGMGKTRLSRAFKDLVAPRSLDSEEEDESELSRDKILYYNALTEDLFHWDNNLERDLEYTLKIQPNTFTDWVLRDQGQDMNVITTFQRYTSDKLTPRFNPERIEKAENRKQVIIKPFSEVTFSMETGDATHSGKLKISKGEESIFIWSIFFTLIEQIVGTLNEIDPDLPEATPFDELKCVFIDDPVSSLDDNHLIHMAVDLAQLIKSNKSEIKFVITTHNPLFFNVLSNEFGSDQKTDFYKWRSKSFAKYRLDKDEDGSIGLFQQPNDSPFAYHLHLLFQLQEATKSGQVEKYHFNLLRNILEKAATFLGYKRWDHLLPQTEDGLPNPYAKRIVNFSSHSKHAAEEVQPLKPEEKRLLENLVNHLVNNHKFWQEKPNG